MSIKDFIVENTPEVFKIEVAKTPISEMEKVLKAALEIEQRNTYVLCSIKEKFSINNGGKYFLPSELEFGLIEELRGKGSRKIKQLAPYGAELVCVLQTYSSTQRGRYIWYPHVAIFKDKLGALIPKEFEISGGSCATMTNYH